MNKLPKSVEKRFDKKFPYRGMILEDNGTHYTMKDIKQFLADEIARIVESVPYRKFKPHKITDANKKFIGGYNTCVEAWKIEIKQHETAIEQWKQEILKQLK